MSAGDVNKFQSNVDIWGCQGALEHNLWFSDGEAQTREVKWLLWGHTMDAGWGAHSS